MCPALSRRVAYAVAVLLDGLHKTHLYNKTGLVSDIRGFRDLSPDMVYVPKGHQSIFSAPFGCSREPGCHSLFGRDSTHLVSTSHCEVCVQLNCGT